MLLVEEDFERVVLVPDVLAKGVVLVTGSVVFTVGVPVERVGIVVLDNGFAVVPENDDVMMMSIYLCFHVLL